ncbi:MAG: sensor histidine kinase [Cytophagia bacterium]|nr:sensor histidine kinase [Cytophagia bacterium]
MKQLAKVLKQAGQSPIELRDTTSSGDQYLQLTSYLNRGYYFLYTNSYSDKPFEYFSEAYRIAQNLNFVEAEKYALISLLEIYNFQVAQSNQDASIFLNRLEELIQDEADRYHYLINVVQFNLRSIFIDIKIDLPFYAKFDAVMSSFDQTHKFWPNYYSIKGAFFETLNRREEAVVLHLKAINSITNEPFLKHIKFRSFIRLSEINRRLKKFDQALNYINQASEYIDKSDTTRSLFHIHDYLSRIYSDSKDYEMAYKNLLKSNDYKYKLDYEQNTLEIARLNVRYQTQEKELALLKEREKVRDTKNMLGGSVLLIVFISITYFLVQKNTKRKQLLAESEKDLERQRVVSLLKEQELVSIDAMIAGQEKERQRLANELHDDLGGLLASIKLHFHTLLDTEDTESNKKFEKTDSLINEAYDKVRAIAHAKNSGVIAKEGFLRSLEEMADKVSIANNLTVTVIEHGLDERLENSIELSLFRIIQELITNVIRHSNATEANIHLTKHDHTLNIMVEDNGEGFDSSGITLKSGGMGIKSIDKRVAFLNGTMNIESEIGQGTTVILEIPL